MIKRGLRKVIDEHFYESHNRFTDVLKFSVEDIILQCWAIPTLYYIDHNRASLT
jgi:hypothetical protein